MKVNTALILCAGYGKRLLPLTSKKPKPLLELKHKTLLEKCINLIAKLNVKKIIINTFYMEEQIFEFVKKKNFSIDIEIIRDGKKILNTGGGILNMIQKSSDNDFLVFNPDTVWSENYLDEILKMENFYFSNKLNNILLLVKKDLSFDKNLKGDFDLKINQINRDNKEFTFIGCQILNKNLFKNYKVNDFPISEIWNKLLSRNQLNGFESLNKFYHLTNFEVFNKLKDL
tara:strand:- start:1314 stop:2000 length:687 start_codon:yes stop_codon:yes gene_type:complete